jgi:2-aminophenol/2-amino-5-chlorophenol 1,6-dioxygenase alpha subunit
MLASNNLYHDWERTEELGAISVNAAEKLGKRVAVIVIGGLSGSFYRGNIDISNDKIFSEEQDVWNKRMLELMSEGRMTELFQLCPKYASEANVDMGFKHMAFLKGALGSKIKKGHPFAYEPLYGKGSAVIEFSV